MNEGIAVAHTLLFSLSSSENERTQRERDREPMERPYPFVCVCHSLCHKIKSKKKHTQNTNPKTHTHHPRIENPILDVFPSLGETPHSKLPKCVCEERCRKHRINCDDTSLGFFKRNKSRFALKKTKTNRKCILYIHTLMGRTVEM